MPDVRGLPVILTLRKGRQGTRVRNRDRRRIKYKSEDRGGLIMLTLIRPQKVLKSKGRLGTEFPEKGVKCGSEVGWGTV